MDRQGQGQGRHYTPGTHAATPSCPTCLLAIPAHLISLLFFPSPLPHAFLSSPLPFPYCRLLSLSLQNKRKSLPYYLPTCSNFLPCLLPLPPHLPLSPAPLYIWRWRMVGRAWVVVALPNNPLPVPFLCITTPLHLPMPAFILPLHLPQNTTTYTPCCSSCLLSYCLFSFSSAPYSVSHPLLPCSSVPASVSCLPIFQTTFLV